MQPIRCASIFAGIGGFELGLSWSIPNLEVVWQVEIDSYCRDVLNKHFPKSTKYVDVRTFDKTNNIDRNIDMLIAGFPCQDISIASKNRRGLDGKKSGLFWDLHRVISNLRPKIVLLENVTAITLPGGGMDRVLYSLSEIGYCVEWFRIRASDFGLPHRRERIFFVCYATDTDCKRFMEHKRQSQAVQQSQFQRIQREETKNSFVSESTHRINNNATDPNGSEQSRLSNDVTPLERTTTDTDCERPYKTYNRRTTPTLCKGDSIQQRRPPEQPPKYCRPQTRPEKTPPPEPTIHRVDDGFSTRLHNNRLKALGNAIVPQKTAWIGKKLISTGLIRDVLGPEYVCES